MSSLCSITVSGLASNTNHQFKFKAVTPGSGAGGVDETSGEKVSDLAPTNIGKVTGVSFTKNGDPASAVAIAWTNPAGATDIKLSVKSGADVYISDAAALPKDGGGSVVQTYEFGSVI